MPFIRNLLETAYVVENLKESTKTGSMVISYAYIFPPEREVLLLYSHLLRLLKQNCRNGMYEIGPLPRIWETNERLSHNGSPSSTVSS